MSYTESETFSVLKKINTFVPVLKKREILWQAVTSTNLYCTECVAAWPKGLRVVEEDRCDKCFGRTIVTVARGAGSLMHLEDCNHYVLSPDSCLGSRCITTRVLQPHRMICSHFKQRVIEGFATFCNIFGLITSHSFIISQFLNLIFAFIIIF